MNGKSFLHNIKSESWAVLSAINWAGGEGGGGGTMHFGPHIKHADSAIESGLKGV